MLTSSTQRILGKSSHVTFSMGIESRLEDITQTHKCLLSQGRKKLFFFSSIFDWWWANIYLALNHFHFFRTHYSLYVIPVIFFPFKFLFFRIGLSVLCLAQHSILEMDNIFLCVLDIHRWRGILTSHEPYPASHSELILML